MIGESELYKLKEHLLERKDKIGLIGTRLNVRQNQGNSVFASISQDWKEIDIDYGKEVNLVPDGETKDFAVKKGIEDAVKTVGEDLLEHEAGHRENKVGEKAGCPYDLETHEEIKDAVARGLEKVGKKGLESYVTNAFEDVLDNINCRRHTGFAGQTLFWNNQGVANSKDGKFDPFYEAFVRANLFLGGDLSSHTLLKRFFSGEKSLDATKQFLAYITRATGEQSPIQMHKKQGFSRLFKGKIEDRRKLWADLGYKFAVTLGPLLEDTPGQRMFGSCEGDENSDKQNPFDREMKIPGNRQKIALGRYEQGKGPAAHRDTQEQLYDLYKAISKEIPVEASHYSASQKMPLVHFGRRFVKEDEQRFRFKGVRIGEDGELGLRTTKHSIEFPVAYKKKPHNFPKLKIAIMDRSGSMALNSDNGEDVGDKSYIPWGNKSKHHFGLKGYFGIDNFFERQGILQYVDNCVLGLSGESAVKGRADLVAKSLLTEPSGGTSLDVAGLEAELEDGAFVMSISDGEFSLNGEDKTRFETKLKGCDYAHIQIGNETAFSGYLRGLGVPVVKVKGDEDLSKAMVSFVSGYYRKLPTGGEAK